MRMRLLVPLLVAAPLLGSGCKIHGFSRGCIKLDGKGGYRNVADALTLAQDGSVLALCDKDVNESVEIDKKVTLQGLGGGSTVWIQADGQPAITVKQGGQATLDGIWFQGNGTDVVVEGGGAVVANNVQITAPTWGIDASDGSVTGTGIVVEDATQGGIHMSGQAATLTLSGSRIDGNVGWGVLLENGAQATITGGVLRNTFVSDQTGSKFDGWGVGLKSGSTASVSGATTNGNVLGVLYAEGSSTATLDSIDGSGNYFAVWADNSDVTLTNSTIQNSQQYDVVAANGASLDIEGTTLSADASTSAYEDLSNTLVGSYGILMQGGVGLTVKDTTISGHNGGGMWVVGSVSQDMPAEIDNTTIDDNASQGILFQWVDATMNGVTVTGTRNNDAGCVDQSTGTLQCNWGVGTFSSSVDWTGGTLSGSEGLGLLVQGGSGKLSGVDFADNAIASMEAVSSALALTDGTVSGTGAVGIEAQDTVLQVDHTDFSDRDYTQSYVDSSGNETRYHDAALDIYASGGTTALSNLTFTNDESGISLSQSDATLSDLAFSGCTGPAISQAYGTLKALRITVDQGAPGALACTGTGPDGTGAWADSMSASNLTITNTARVDYLVETFDSSGTSTGSTTVTQAGPVISATGCNTTLKHVAITGADDNAIATSDADASLTDVTVKDVAQAVDASSTPAVALAFPTLASPTVLGTSLTISGVGAGDALSLTASPAATGDQVLLEELSIGRDDGDGISGVAGRGMVLSDVGCADTSACQTTVRYFDMANLGGAGIDATGSWATILGPSTDATFTGTIVGAGGDGVSSTPDTTPIPTRNGGLVVQDVTVTSPAGSGLSLVAGNHSVTGLTVSGAGAWGMECATDPPADVPTFDVCTPTALDGASGALSGCDACTLQ